MDPIETFTSNRFTAAVYHDEDPESPREWDNLGTMVCWHRRYNLGDKQVKPWEGDSLEDMEASFMSGVCLPLYLYDHSGLTMRTYSFGDPWDSGQVGFIYATEEKLREEYSCPSGDIPPETLELAKEVLVGEVETYVQYLTGQVYGYVVTNEACEHVDSCWGFFGLDYAIEEAKAALECAYPKEG